MEIIEDKALMVRVRNHERVTTAIKQSRYIEPVGDSAHDVLVKWNLENSRKLANLGLYKTPSPILRDYQWVGSYTPYDHQKQTASFLTANNRAFCFSEQGTGKTGAVIWAADYLLSIGDIKKVLIVCPLSIMHSAWMQDIFTIAMHRTAAVAHGSKETRRKIIDGDYDFTIINYDGVPLVADDLAGKFDLVVADEANFVKTPTTRRWKALNKVLRPDTKLWMLTGTPAAQSPVDAYGLAKMCVPQRVPRYFTAWRDSVMTKVSQFRYIPSANATKLVNAALQPAVRFTKADCLDLPPVTYTTREIEMTAQQKKFYKELKKQMYVEAAGEQISAVHAAAGLNKLLQLSCGAVYSDTGEVVQFDAKNRLDEVSEVVSEAAHKVIVFVPFRHAIEIVAERLRKEGYTTEIINGGVSMKNRTQIFKDFQKTDNPRVLVIQPQSAAHGVTLTAADTIVWFGPTSSVETWLQANERINRPSQQNKMTIIKIYGSEVEKKVYSALESKEANQKDLVKLYEQEIRQ
jgi:SNF2 family DNA or RNA helicase